MTQIQKRTALILAAAVGALSACATAPSTVEAPQPNFPIRRPAEAEPAPPAVRVAAVPASTVQVGATLGSILAMFLAAPFTRAVGNRHAMMIGLGGAGFHRLFAAAFPQSLTKPRHPQYWPLAWGSSSRMICIARPPST